MSDDDVEYEECYECDGTGSLVDEDDDGTGVAYVCWGCDGEGSVEVNG